MADLWGICKHDKLYLNIRLRNLVIEFESAPSSFMIFFSLFRARVSLKSGFSVPYVSCRVCRIRHLSWCLDNDAVHASVKSRRSRNLDEVVRGTVHMFKVIREPVTFQTNATSSRCRCSREPFWCSPLKIPGIGRVLSRSGSWRGIRAAGPRGTAASAPYSRL